MKYNRLLKFIFWFLFFISISANADFFSSASVWYPGDGNVRFIDLTGIKYKGSDEDLIGLNFLKMGIYCSGSSSYIGNLTDRGTIISWQDESGKYPPSPKPGFAYLGSIPTIRIKNYKIYFRVKNRFNKAIHEEAFIYEDSTKHRGEKSMFWKGKVYNERTSYDGCERDYVELSKNINLAYATVEYWVEKIEWFPGLEKTTQPEPDRKAFTLEKQFKAVEKK